MPVKSIRFKALKLFQIPELKSSFKSLKLKFVNVNFNSGVRLDEIKIVLKSIKSDEISADIAI